MSEYLLQRLRDAIAAASSKPIIICGAGVTIHATENRAPGWRALIVSGIERALQLNSKKAAWGAYALERLDSQDAREWIQVADELTALLGGQGNAEFFAWLKEQLGDLRPVSDTLVREIVALRCPIATTNYDDVLSLAAGVRPIPWTESDQVVRVVNEGEPGIIHLHGHWSMPDSIVLGASSYQKSLEDSRRTFVQRMWTLNRPSIFIGCSADGLADPDFERLDEFVRGWKGVAQPRYVLVTNDEAARLRIDSDTRMFPICYGETHSQLASFIKSFLPSSKQSPRNLSPNSIDQSQPKPPLFGRSSILKQVAQQLLSGGSAIIGGAPGIGKTALAVCVLYETEIIGRFREFRSFVSLDSAAEARAIISRTNEAVGLPSMGDPAALLRILSRHCSQYPTAIILDNSEGVFELDQPDSERIVRLMSQIDGLSLIVTIRGSPPYLPGLLIIDDLPKLDSGASREAFLEVSGQAYSQDENLSDLLEILDGHTLSIQLVAAQVMASGDLSGVRESWEERHAEILRKPGAAEDRLTSVRASMALSIGSPIMRSSPLARRLLSLLAHLPGGVMQDDVQKLLGETGQVTRVRASDAIFPLQRLRLVERRLDRRLRMLTPLRESVKLDQKILPADKKRMTRRYLRLAASSQDVGTDKWLRTKEIVEGEIDNLDPVCIEVADRDPGSIDFMNAVEGIEDLVRFTGRCGFRSIEIAAERAVQKALDGPAAAALCSLGNIWASRDDRPKSIGFYNQALHFARRAGWKVTEGNILVGLADVSMANSDHSAALARLEAAEKLFELRKAHLGISNVKHGRAEIAVRGLDVAAAKVAIAEAQSSYAAIEQAIGQVNCKFLLLKLDRGCDVRAWDTLIDQYSALGSDSSTALALSEKGEALRRIGDYHSAVEALEAAVTKAQVNGMAEEFILLRLGRSLIEQGDVRKGLERVGQGFEAYFAKALDQDLARPGWLALRDAIYSGKSGLEHRVGNAFSRWHEVGREDHVREWQGIEVSWNSVDGISAP